MSEFLDKLATTLATPENNRKLSTFLGVLQTLVAEPAPSTGNTFTTLLDDGNLLSITKDGISVSRHFLQNLGSFELVVNGAPLSSNMQVSLTAVAPAEPVDAYANTIEFVKEGNKYRPNIGAGFIDCIDEIGIVNLLKRPVLEPGAFTFVKNYFANKGFKVYVVGDEPISAPAVVATVTAENSAVGASVPSVATATQVVYVDKVVVTEKVVEVVKHVVTEKLVEVEKIVIKEVPIYLPAKVPVVAEPVVAPVVEPTKEVPMEKKKGPIEEPSDDEGTGSSAEEESDEEQEEESGDEESGDEESEPEEEESAEKTTKKLKGMWLNDDHTILKSGEFVYRVNKKIKGPPELVAIGRWDKEKKTRVPLRKGDDKIVKSLGNRMK